MRSFTICTIGQTLLGPNRRIRRSGHAISMDEQQSNFKAKTMNEGKPERPGCV